MQKWPGFHFFKNMGDSGLLYALCAGTAFKFAGLTWLANRKPDSLQRVAKVTQLFIYPLKSCRGIEVQEAHIGVHGVEVAGARDR